MRTLSPEEKDRLRPGDSIMITIQGGRGLGDMITLSIDQAMEERGWLELQEHLKNGDSVTARVVEQNRGGVVVNYQGIRGFVPFSQLTPMPNETRDQLLAERMGQEYLLPDTGGGTGSATARVIGARPLAATAGSGAGAFYCRAGTG